MKRVLVEGFSVALCGALVAFAANELSPRGLSLGRNYFPKPKPPPEVGATNAPVQTHVPGTNSLELLRQRLTAAGMTLADSNQVKQLFYDPRRGQNLVIFIDARDDEYYAKGHIPGAYQFDYYRPERHLPAVLPACQVAEQIVLYCNGGDCEDSEFSANFLREAGIDARKLVVYGGGMTEWSTNGLPVELGAQHSGEMKTP